VAERVDQDVDASECVDGFLDACCDGAGAGQVGDDSQCASVPIADGRNNGLRSVGVDVGDRDVGAMFGVQQGGC
jgi:hypothetical protein